MSAKKVLFVSQAIEPYVPKTEETARARRIPEGIQELGAEIRTFHPKWGNINERRNQLHEVIRLSGLNVIIDDTDHPLIIKVATLQPAHMQIYFIDNEDYFNKRLDICDQDGNEYTDNYERMIFYARSVLETIKKLRWYPDIIHCQGWMGIMMPYYIKTAYKDDPSFANAKVVYSIMKNGLTVPPPENIAECMAFRETTADDIRALGYKMKTYDDMVKMAMNYSDAIIGSEPGIKRTLLTYAKAQNKPFIVSKKTAELSIEDYNAFYDLVLAGATDEATDAPA